MQERYKINVVVVGVEGEINLGFIVRLCANFNVDRLVLVNPQVDPFSDTVRRFAANGVWFLEKGHVTITDSLEEALKDSDVSACTSAKVGGSSDVLRHAFTLREFAEKIAPKYKRIAVVFGRESVGLTREELAACNMLVHIPANPEYPVLNLSHAVAIVLYELFISLNKVHTRRFIHEPPPSEVLKRSYEHLRHVVERVVDRERIQTVLAAIKHVLWGCELSSGEASALYYFAKRARRVVDECTGKGGV
jgi:TrmH family RNA methyltransferase